MLNRIAFCLAIVAFAGVCGISLSAETNAEVGTSAAIQPFGADVSIAQFAHATPRYSTDDFIVKFAADLPQSDQDTLVTEYGCEILDTCVPGGFHRVSVPPESAPEEMVACFQTEGAVEYAELNHYASIFFEPNDPYYSYQWHLDNDTTGGINTTAAWNIEQGDPNVIVAVVDTGIAYENYGRFRRAPDLAETLFVPGYDFVNGDAHPNDDEGHGTHVAGTIAQSTNNDVGVAGIAFRCAVMPVKVLDSSGEGDYFSIAQGIYFSVNNGARVINMSFGSPQNSTTLRQAVAYAYQQGVTLVCAAGNEYQQGNAPSYPAAYDDYCIAVGAVRYDNTHAYYSSTGSYLDLAAPGGDLTVDQNHDGYPDGVLQQTFTVDPTSFSYFFFQGTSMATPHVSGVAALLVSRGVTQPDRVRQAMQMTARDEGDPGWDAEYGWGVVDANAALSYHTAGDINGDNLANGLDLQDFSALWLQSGSASAAADFNADGIVDYRDFAVLAENWLK